MAGQRARRKMMQPWADYMKILRNGAQAMAFK